MYSFLYSINLFNRQSKWYEMKQIFFNILRRIIQYINNFKAHKNRLKDQPLTGGNLTLTQTFMLELLSI